jgi:uncharacterized membrane protein
MAGPRANKTLDLALMVFPEITGAERAYTSARDRAAGDPWLREVAFVEHHRHDRLVVRGTVAGHYLDVDDQGDPMGPRAGEGALTGAAVGLLLGGPPGLAAGLTAGGAVGGEIQSDSAPHHHDALLDDFRLEIPEKSSALALLAEPAQVDRMVAALDDTDGELIRHHLGEQQANALLTAVADAPSAAD